MSLAILTKFLPVTNKLGNRYKAVIIGMNESVIVSANDPQLGVGAVMDGYELAANRLCQKINLNGNLVRGDIYGSGWNFVFIYNVTAKPIIYSKAVGGGAAYDSAVASAALRNKHVLA